LLTPHYNRIPRWFSTLLLIHVQNSGITNIAVKKDGFVKSSNSRRVNFVIMRRTFRTLNDYEMQHNAEVGLFTRPSKKGN